MLVVAITGSPERHPSATLPQLLHSFFQQAGQVPQPLRLWPFGLMLPPETQAQCHKLPLLPPSSSQYPALINPPPLLHIFKQRKDSLPLPNSSYQTVGLPLPACHLYAVEQTLPMMKSNTQPNPTIPCPDNLSK